jgi:hypothetical protein
MKKKLLFAAMLAMSASSVFAASEYSYEIINAKNKQADLKHLNREAADYVRDVKKILTDAALTDPSGKVIYLLAKKESNAGNGAFVCLRHVTIDPRTKEKALYRVSSATRNGMGRVTNEDDLRVFLSGQKEVSRSGEKAAAKGAKKLEKAFLELTVGTQFQFMSCGKTFQGEVVLKDGKSLCFARVELGGAGGSDMGGDEPRESFDGDRGGEQSRGRSGSRESFGDRDGGDQSRGRSSSRERFSDRDGDDQSSDRNHSGSRSSSNRNAADDNY